MQNPLSLVMQPIRLQLRELWVTHLQPRYDGLSARERLIVQFAVFVLPVMLLVFGVLLPLHDTKLAMQQELEKTITQANQVKVLAAQVESQGGSQVQDQASGNALALVEKLARQTKVREFMTHIRPRPALDGKQRLQLQMKAVQYIDVIQFLDALAQHHLNIDSASISADTQTDESGKQTLAQGLVQVNLMVSES